MVLQNLIRNFYEYVADDGVSYQVATTEQNAAVNGATPITPGSLPSFPRGWKMRHLYGFDPLDNARTKVPIFHAASTLWQGSTVTFTKNGAGYSVEGKIGEVRSQKGG